MPLRVLASPAGTDSRANPYISQLYRHLGSQVEVREFSRRALLDRPDVVHVHWPEFLLRSERAPRMALDALKVLSLLWLARRRGAVLIWTGHDLSPHERRHPLVLRAFQRGFAALVDHMINLADAAGPLLRQRYPELAAVPMTTVRHGHYRGVHPSPPDRETARRELGIGPGARVLLLAGQMREYKNAPSLIREVRRSDDLRLVVAGAPHTPELADEIRRATGDDPRICLVLRHLGEDELAAVHAAADVVVLPYRPGSTLHSGAAHLAVSLDRPVVLARSAVAAEFQRSVGHSWVSLHDGTVADAVLRARSLALHDRYARPDLDQLDWPGLAAQTLTVYRSALARRGRSLRPGLTSMWGHGWDDHLDVIDSREHPRLLEWLITFWRLSRGRRAVILRGTVTLREGYRDLLGAVLLRRLRRDPPLVVMSDATITPASTGLSRRIGPLAPAVRPLARLLIRAADGPRVRWCVLSRVERQIFADTWGVPLDRVVFTPFQHTLFDPLDQEVPPAGEAGGRRRIFSGGNSLRDHQRLLDACDGLPVDVFVATATMREHRSPTVEIRHVGPREFTDRLRDCDIHVVPLARSGRSAGQQTYLNGMLLEKVTIVSDPLRAADDYVRDGETGVVVGDSVADLRAALVDALDPARSAYYEGIRRQARRSVLTAFTPRNYWATLMAVAGLAGETGDVTSGRQDLGLPW